MQFTIGKLSGKPNQFQLIRRISFLLAKRQNDRSGINFNLNAFVFRVHFTSNYNCFSINYCNKIKNAKFTHCWTKFLKTL